MTTKKDKAAYDKIYYQKNKEKRIQYSLIWAKNNPEKRKTINRKEWLKRTYKLSLEEYQEKLIKQKHCCAVCGKHQSEFKRRFAVDHNHKTMEVRDLLCHNCNYAFGCVNEDIQILKKLIKYAKRHLSDKT
jgi:hypothetical protein